MGAQVGAIAHLYRLAKISVNGDIAAVAVALVASASVIGRLSGGWLLLKVSARAFTLVMFALQACALVVLSSAHDAAVLLIGTVLFGLSMGNVLMMPLAGAAQQGLIRRLLDQGMLEEVGCLRWQPLLVQELCLHQLVQPTL